jgi:hypothetical protein
MWRRERTRDLVPRSSSAACWPTLRPKSLVDNFGASGYPP